MCFDAASNARSRSASLSTLGPERLPLARGEWVASKRKSDPCIWIPTHPALLAPLAFSTCRCTDNPDES
eukprot:10105152-Alexandrium_andersonii.AAC.1